MFRCGYIFYSRSPQVRSGKDSVGAGEVARRLTVHPALAEDLSLVPSIRVETFLLLTAFPSHHLVPRNNDSESSYLLVHA